METKLVVVGGKANRKEIRLKIPATLGRGKDADLTVAHPLVSRHHCRLEEVDGALVLRDNNSTNGTFVGDKRITQVVLKPGDQFTIGPLTFKAVYKHTGDFPKVDKSAGKAATKETADFDFTVESNPKEAAKAKPAAAKPDTKTRPAAAKSDTKTSPAETKPVAKPAEKKPAAKAKPEPVVEPAASEPDDIDNMDWLAEPTASAPAIEADPLADLGLDDEPLAEVAPAEVAPVEAEDEDLDALPPAAEEDADVMDWLEEPAKASAPVAEPETLAEVNFEDEPLADLAPAEAAPAEEFDALPLAAEPESEALDWLEEPAAASAPAAEPEPLADLGFGDEPLAEVAPAEVAPVEAEDEDLGSLPPSAEGDADIMDWLEEPAKASAPVAEPEPLAEVSFEDEPLADLAPAETARVDEFDALPPAAEPEAEALDWLEEPAAASAPVTEPEPLADLGFGDEPPAEVAPAEVTPVEAEDDELGALPPAAEEDADVMDWLEEPAKASAPVAEPEPLAEMSFEDEPLADLAPAEAAPAEEFDALPPAAEPEAEALDWLEEPAAASAPAAEPEPLADLGFGDEPLAEVASAEAAPADVDIEDDELGSLPPAAEEDADVMDWLEEPSAASAPVAEPEPLAGLASTESAPAEEFNALPPPAEPEAEMLDWLEEPSAASAPVVEPEPLTDLGLGDESPLAGLAPTEVAPVEEFNVPPSATEDDADVMDWLEEPAAASPLTMEPELPAEFGFGDEPIADAAPVEEFGALPPAVEEEGEVLDWLAEPAAESAPSAEPEPLSDLGFGDEPIAVALPVEATPIDQDDIVAIPPAAEEESEGLDWLESAAASAVEPEPVAEPALDSQPMDMAGADEVTLPAADAEDDVFDWLNEPSADAPPAEAGLPGGIDFGEEPIAAEPRMEFGESEEPSLAEELPEPALPEAELDDFAGEGNFAGEDQADEIALPAAEAGDDFMNWLETPSTTAPQAEAKSLDQIAFDEEPIAALPLEEAPLEDAAPVEAEALVPPASESGDDFMDWLSEPDARGAQSEVESPESLSFDEEPVPAEPIAELGSMEEPIAAEALPELELPAEAIPEAAEEVTLPAAEAGDDFMNWLETPSTAAPPAAESFDEIAFDEEPVAAVPLETVSLEAEALEAESLEAEPLEDAEPAETQMFAPPAGNAADADDNFMDWLSEPESSAAPAEVESPESLSFDEEPVLAEALPEAGIIEEPPVDNEPTEEAGLIASPAVDAEAGFMDWLEEPAAENGAVEAEPLVDFGLDEQPVAAEPLDEAEVLEESEPISAAEALPATAEADDDGTAFWSPEAAADPQVEDQASDEMDFNFDDEPAAEATVDESPVAAEPMFDESEPMFAEEEVVAATPEDEPLEFGGSSGMDEHAAESDATEIFTPSEEADDQNAFGAPTEAFELAEAKAEEEPAEFDFLSNDAAMPVASDEFALRDEPVKRPSRLEPREEPAETVAEKPAKKGGWWPFGKSKKEKPAKKEKPEKKKPESKGKKSAAKEPEPEPITLDEVEADAFAPQEEFAAPLAPQASSDAEGMPDFTFGDVGNDTPAKSGGDDDMEDFFQDLGLK